MSNYPDFIQEAIHKVIDGTEQSILYQATKSQKAVPELSGRLEKQAQHAENLRACFIGSVSCRTLFGRLFRN